MSSEIAVNISGLSKIYFTGFFRKRYDALSELDLQVKQGEILGYLGPNGAGKTTTFKIILNLIRPSKGHVEIFGQNYQSNAHRDFIGYLPENPYLYPFLTGTESLEFHGNLYGIEKKILKDRITKLFKQVGLEHAKDRPLRKYSRGMLQRLGIAQALINDPKLLILDEPMSGLDPFGRKDMRDIILSCRDQGKTVIFSSHILSDVEMMCDRAAIILNGKLRDVVNVSEVLDSNIKHWEVCTNVNYEIVSEYLATFKGVTVTSTEKQTLYRFNEEQNALEFVEKIKDCGGKVVSYIPQRESLEEIFVKYTNKTKK